MLPLPDQARGRVHQIDFQTAHNPNDLMLFGAVNQIALVQAHQIVPGGREMSNVGVFGEWLGRRVWHQRLAEMLQNR